MKRQKEAPAVGRQPHGKRLSPRAGTARKQRPEGRGAGIQTSEGCRPRLVSEGQHAWPRAGPWERWGARKLDSRAVTGRNRRVRGKSVAMVMWGGQTRQSRHGDTTGRGKGSQTRVPQTTAKGGLRVEG